MPTCPNGHQSASDDWCEVCGHRMGTPEGPPAVPSYGYGFPPTAGEPTAQAELCPQCRTPREAMAPFCEECRYNFLTRSATSYASPTTDPGPSAHGGGTGAGAGAPAGPRPGSPPPPPVPAPGTYGQDHFEYQGSRPSRVNRPAEPLQREDDWMLSPPAHEPPPAYQQAPQPPQPQYQQQPPPSHQREYQQEYRQQPQTPPYQPLPPQGGSWSATIGPDRSYFMAMMQRSGPEATGLNLPAYSPEQHLPLSGGQITIGRRRASTGESPDIDLSVPPEDPGVSHQHAVLVQQPDMSWAVVDQNSTNGTTINGGEDPIQPYVPVPLADGDRVHVGAWTTITIRRG
ncbi:MULTISPECIES: FHA domain-containing protein [Streptomyces]|uniref:FHA domain-containing protein n=1 Tax=Streptomyces TaxID=1883 RepID=UPI0004BD9B8F|nr:MULTISPECIES: FHA domain-containing protein [Streptomyces]KJY20366.1 forkhead-associated protein [Streptomyces sp. NRRL S-104]KOU68758.1 forkhead-associated protein [Streptomyces sp. IGB124]KOU73864.1 forkhead-associated protein [Streptomyces sp. XY66]KOU84726.1 forkhead-associated protein [Streptomyces sp. XY58]KOV04918.1 forkhead-associated protein [Streptomyces sp. XY37]